MSEVQAPGPGTLVYLTRSGPACWNPQIRLMHSEFSTTSLVGSPDNSACLFTINLSLRITVHLQRNCKDAQSIPTPTHLSRSC